MDFTRSAGGWDGSSVLLPGFFQVGQKDTGTRQVSILVADGVSEPQQGRQAAEGRPAGDRHLLCSREEEPCRMP